MNPKAKTKMLKDFETFIKDVDIQYWKVYAMLSGGNYQGARDALASLSNTHARTAMNLRSMMIREGFLPDEEK